MPSVRISERGEWWVTFAVVLLVGVAWSFGSPLMRAPDEPAHVLRAVAVAHGQLTMDHHRVAYGGGLAGPVIDLRVRRAYALLDDPGPMPADPDRALRSSPIGPDGPTVDSTTVAVTYPLTYYAMTGWPSLIFDARWAVPLMRIVSAAWGSALIASGVASMLRLRRSRADRANGGLLLAGAALVMTPMTWFLLASVNPNGLEIAAAFCLWTTALAVGEALATPDSTIATRLIMRVAVAASLLAMMRLLSPVVLVAVAAAVGALVLDCAAIRRALADRRIRAALAVVTTVTVVSESALAWFGLDDSLVTQAATPGGRGQILRHSIDATPAWTRQLIGELGWLDTPLPTSVVWPWLLACLALAIAAIAVARPRGRTVLVAIAAATFAMPILAEVVSGPTVAMVWQGRYTLPIAMGIPIVAAYLLDRSRRVSARTERAVSITLVVGVAVGVLRSLLAMVNWYSAGEPGSWLTFVHARGGVYPWSWITIVVLGATAISAWLAWMLRLLRGSGGDGDRLTDLVLRDVSVGEVDGLPRLGGEAGHLRREQG